MTPTALSVVRAGAGDVDVIARFNVSMAEETEAKVLDPAIVRAGVGRMVADDALGFYLVARRGADVCGCLGVTFEWSDWRNGLFWWIQSVYVEPAARSHGVFTAMYDETCRLARSAPGVIGLRLYAERDNARAIRTYHRLGMTTTDYDLLEVEFPPDDH